MGVKFVLIGAGSATFGSRTVIDVLLSEELAKAESEIWLVDIDEKRLERVYKFSKLVAAHLGRKTRIFTNIDRSKALPDADYVITSIATHRAELWEQDFRVPISYGFNHPYGENGGPGSVFHALRNLKILIPICEDVKRLAPNAKLFNFTNPESKVLHSMISLTGVEAYGLCHGIYACIGFITKYMDIPRDKIEVTSAGLNHFYYVKKVINKETGEDILPILLDKIKNDKNMPASLWKRFVEIFDWLSYPDDYHIGEYVSFGAEYTGTKYLFGLESRPIGTPVGIRGWRYRMKKVVGDKFFEDIPEEPEISMEDLLDEYIEGRSLDDKILKPSGEVLIPIIEAIESNTTLRVDAINCMNDGLYIENLRSDGVVEIPAHIDSNGIHPINVGKLPESVSAYMNLQISIQNMITETYRTKSKKILLQTLLIDPFVNSIEKAKSLIDDMLELQKDFLPEFH